MQTSKKLYIIDGYGFVFRAYHSMPPLTNAAGTPVGAIYGFTNMLIKLLKDHNPDYICVALDSGKETFRTAMYPAYKANRPPAPDDLIPQFPMVRDVVDAVGLKSFELVGYEADDVIATFTRKATSEGIEVTIVSSDKDLMQLVDDGLVNMFDPIRQRYITSKEVVEKFGVMPAKVLDASALIGDSSDNVPGAPGIGPKTAAELINQFDNLDELLVRTAEIKQPKRREVLEQNRDQILLSRELIRLHFDVPLEVSFDSLKPNQDTGKLAQFCQTHGFKSLVARLSGSSASAQPVAASATVQQPKVERGNKNLTSIAELEGWLKGKSEIAVYADDNALIISSENENSCLKFQQGSADLFGDGGGGIDKAAALKALQKTFDDHLVHKIFYDAKGLLGYLPESSDDVQIMEYTAQTGLSLPEFKMEKPGKKAAEEDVRSYMLACGAEIFERYHQARAQLFEKRQLTIYEKIEKSMISVLGRMEKRGAKIDTALLKTYSDAFAVKLSELEKQIHAIAGLEFNIGSPAQLGEVLFDRLGFAGGKKSAKTGQYSTGADVLEDLALAGHEIAQKVLDWRQIAKLKSTYTDALPLAVNIKTGRVHTKFNMTVAATGRLSSTEPNLQNIPIRSEEGRKIRNAFIAAPGHKLISADYSQIELRLLADIANIGPLKEAFKNGQDVHAITAHQVFGVPLDNVNAEHRRMAKTINFGIIYGLSAHGLAERLRISRSDAARFIDAYFTQYPGIKEYMNRTIDQCRSDGYVTTVTGRKLYIRGINDKNGAIRQFSERAAINAPLQGSASDIIKLAMLELDKKNFPMTLQVHDELLFEVPEGSAEEMRGQIVTVMQNAVQLSVPLVVEANIGNNWGEVH